MPQDDDLQLNREKSRAGDLIELLREIGRVPISELEGTRTIGGLVREREPGDWRIKIGRGAEFVIDAG